MVECEAPDIRNRGATGAEVVQRHPHPEGTQFRHELFRLLVLVQQYRLRDFNDDVSIRHARRCYVVRDGCDEFRITDVNGREIDAHPKSRIRWKAPLPRGELSNGPLSDPAVNLLDVAGL